MAGLAPYDEKGKGFLHSTGQAVFQCCDKMAQDRLLGAEALGILCLDGRFTSLTRVKVIQEFMAVIAEETETKVLHREVKLLRDKHNCFRRQQMAPESFANHFCGAIAQYVVLTDKVDTFIGIQFALPMIDYSRRSDSSRSLLILKLTKSISSHLLGIYSICVSDDLLLEAK